MPRGKKAAEDGAKNGRVTAEVDGLTPSQHLALEAMLECGSIAAAARRSGVGERSIRRWMREDPNFRTELRRLREDALAHASLRLQQTASQAVDTLHGLMAGKGRIEPGRVSLVRTALDFAFRSGAYSDLADRVAAMEQDSGPEEEQQP